MGASMSRYTEQEFNEAELAAIAAARKRRFRGLSDTEKLLVRRYWRLAQRRSRDGKPGGDGRTNPEFRAWLKKNGYAVEYSARRYSQWIRDRGRA